MEGLELSLKNAVPMQATELKEVLMKIKNGERAWEQENKDVIVRSMVEHIGSVDSELRDKLIYTLFYRLIIEENLVEHELLQELLEFCLDKLLFKGIGDKDTDTVFTRSFTTLLIALILHRDNEDNFLSQEKVYNIKNQLLDYINQENDLRGYVPIKGWAHSIAHVSDAIDELVKSTKLDRRYYIEILTLLWNKIYVSTSVYVHDEDERILFPILEMLTNGLAQVEIEALLEQLPASLKSQKELLEEEAYWLLYFNCKTFLKTFYMKINTKTELIPLKKSIEKCLSNISLY